MSQGASPYPISQVILRLINEGGFSRTQFVTSLGYRNLERGLNRLSPWVDSGEGFHLIIKQMMKRYPLHAAEIQAAVAATADQKAAEFRAAWIESLKAGADKFVPYIHVEGETTRPSSVCIFGASGGRWNLIEIPAAVLAAGVDEQLAALPDLMRGYLEKHQGQCPFFGKVTGFRFVRLLDYFQFDKECKLVGLVDEPYRRGTAYVSL